MIKITNETEDYRQDVLPTKVYLKKVKDDVLSVENDDFGTSYSEMYIDDTKSIYFAYDYITKQWEYYNEGYVVSDADRDRINRIMISDNVYLQPENSMLGVSGRSSGTIAPYRD